MDARRSGFRRAAAASWALAGLGVAGVAGTSALAFADTFKPAPTAVPTFATDPAAEQPGPPPNLDVPPAPGPVVSPEPAPLVTPEPTAAPAPVPSAALAPPSSPQYTPDYTPRVETIPAPVTHASPVPSTPPTTKRRSLTPTTVMAPNFSPRITISRGS